jgi:hypothetical protein
MVLTDRWYHSRTWRKFHAEYDATLLLGTASYVYVQGTELDNVIYNKLSGHIYYTCSQ